MYEHGLSVAQDFAQAVIWYRKAANQENAAAQYNADNGDLGAYDTCLRGATCGYRVNVCQSAIIEIGKGLLREPFCYA